MRLFGTIVLAVLMALLAFLAVDVCLPPNFRNRAHDVDEAEKASIAGYGEIRTYRDALLDEVPQNVEDWAPATKSKDLNLLMISGGGAAGAFSAGVFSGWSVARTRPQFDVVTGVSAGALIAPYAFLGSAYDSALAHIFTSGVAEELVATKFPVGLIGTSLLKSTRLRQMVEEFITGDVLQQIAAEHRRGRRLLVLTTNLDSQRGVVWNMGSIANSAQPDALQLFQDVLIASASIPGVYPAVVIKAESGGRHFQEMHFDGGAVSQVLMLPQAVLASAERLKSTRDRGVNFYVVVNNALIPEFEPTRNRTLPIIGRAYLTLLKSQTQSELTILYNFTQSTGASFHLATIDIQVPYSMLDPFDTDYMRAIYGHGYAEVIAGNLWKDRPIFR